MVCRQWTIRRIGSVVPIEIGQGKILSGIDQSGVTDQLFPVSPSSFPTR